MTCVEELTCNHEEADTRMMAHAKWSSKETLHFVAADTDILSILLLNFSEFREKQVILDQSAHLRLLDINALVEAVVYDQDQDIMIMKQRRLFPLSFFFGIIHALIGTDILSTWFWPSNGS